VRNAGVTQDGIPNEIEGAAKSIVKLRLLPVKKMIPVKK
jgi:hypothetical protein